VLERRHQGVLDGVLGVRLAAHQGGGEPTQPQHVRPQVVLAQLEESRTHLSLFHATDPSRVRKKTPTARVVAIATQLRGI
jgi:hypothetical protein